MSRLVTAMVAAALVTQAGCAGYTENHRRGLMLVGATAVIAGGFLAFSGAACDRPTDCDQHRREVLGLSSTIGGLLVGGAAFAIKPKPVAP